MGYFTKGFAGECTAGMRAGGASDNARCAGDKAGLKSDIAQCLIVSIVLIGFLSGCNKVIDFFKSRTQESTSQESLSLTQEGSEPVVSDVHGPNISGEIRINPTLEAKAENYSTLFIIAKTHETGPPTAIKRVMTPKFPLKFELGADDIMLPGTTFNGELILIARISRTGNAMPAPGDLEGQFERRVSPGDKDLLLTINRER